MLGWADERQRIEELTISYDIAFSKSDEKKGGKREKEKDEKKKQAFVFFFFHHKTIYEENDYIE